MKKKILLSGLLALALSVPAMCTVSGCGNKDGANVNADEIYALSAVSSAEYLQSLENGGNARTYARPAGIAESDVAGIKNCLTMFKDILGGGITQNVAQNTEQGQYSEYKYVMTMTLPQDGVNTQFKMYYNETSTATSEDYDGGVKETEVSTRLEGIMLAFGSEFEVAGKKEVETEGKEVETSVEFTTKSIQNPSNYIVVEQSVENGETEYEYKIYRDGRKVMETEVEIETGRRVTELEFTLKDSTGAFANKTKYKVVKGNNSSVFEITCKINGTTEKMRAVEKDEGFEITYSNGYTEII